MKTYPWLVTLYVLFLFGCKNVDSEVISKFSCKQDSDCISATKVGCYVACNPEDGSDCSLFSLCPAFNNKFQPSCRESIPCKEPFKIVCDKGKCKSTECETDSDCVSSSKLGCYKVCNAEKDINCTRYPLCPPGNKNKFNRCVEIWSVCREISNESNIICENSQCKIKCQQKNRECCRDSDCVWSEVECADGYGEEFLGCDKVTCAPKLNCAPR